ncbi:MAG: sulfatase [Nocardioidaceae bacterium]|nr:sulfatase [Nocardioidaceae bacterium]
MPRRPAAVVVLSLLLLAGAVLATGATEAIELPASPSGPERYVPTESVGPAPAHRHREKDKPGTVSVAPLTGEKTQPNVVVFMTDDMRYDDLRFMPHVHRLIGDQGVTFTNTFSPQPLCCPARASFLTGEYSHNHHVWSHVAPYGFQALDDSSTLPVWLNRAGYDTQFYGKYLNGYGAQPAPDGGSSLRYVPPGWTDWQGSVDNGRSAGPALDGGTYRYFDTTINDNGRLVPHPGVYQTRLLGDSTTEGFREEARSPRPFFSWTSFVAPHHGGPLEADDPKPVMRSDGSVQVFRNPARPRRVWGRFDDVLRRPPGYRGENDVSDKPFFIRDLPPLTPAEEQGVLANARQRAESLWLVDRQVASMMRTLRRTGQLDDTYVVFTSDNGYFLGEHRMRQGKILPYEPSLRVPLLIRGPGIPKGQVRTDPFTMIDFAPTILDAAGVRVPRTVDGVSLLDVAKHGDRGWRRGILTETGPRAVGDDTEESDNFLVSRHGPSPLRFSQGVRTGDYLYVEHASRERELYDLHADPREVRNLVDEPRMRHVVRLLAHQLDLLRNCKGPVCSRPLPPSLRTRHPEVPARDGTPD